MILGIIASLLYSAEFLVSRKFLGSGNFKSEKFIAVIFIGVSILMLPLMGLFYIDFEQMNLFYTLIFTGIVLSALAYNLLQYKSLKRIKAEDAEPIILLNTIFTIILGYLFIKSERNIADLILALTACTILIISKWDKDMTFNKYHKYMFYAAILIGVYNLLTKIMLDVMNPFALYWIRTIILLPVFLLISKLRMKDLKKYSGTLIISILTILAQLTVFFSYKYIGLITTSLLLNLVPIFTFWGAYIFLKEKLEARNVVASILIIGCIVLSLYL